MYMCVLMHFALVALLAVAPIPATHTLTYSADCDGLTITSSGYDDGATGIFSMADEPPRLLVLNGTGFSPWPDNLDLDGDHHFTIDAVPGDVTEHQSGSVQCEPAPVAPEAEPSQVDIGTIDTTPAAPRPNRAPVPAAEPWVGIELAPPW